MVLTLYLAFVYGIVYLLFEAIPISKSVPTTTHGTMLMCILVFQEYHGWNAIEGGLAFLGLPIGGSIAVVVYALYFNKVYMRKHHAMKPKMVPPEERLKPLMVAAPAFAISFFWGKRCSQRPNLHKVADLVLSFHHIVGWTYYPSINPASPLIAVALMGFAILFMFLSIFNYLM